MTRVNHTHASTGGARVPRAGAAAAAGAALACAVLAGAACSNTSRTQEVRGAAQGAVALPPEGVMAAVPLGDWAGATPNRLASTISNPYAGDQAAVEQGRGLFLGMNCVDCHGYDLKGGMGPNLRDTYWRYGGSPAEIYKSIYEGRPQGMPAWGQTMPPALIWKVVAYIQSFHGAFPPTLADRGRQGDLGDEDTTGARTLRGRQNEEP